MESVKIQITEASSDYELLDSGEGEKLERFGNVVLSRPDPQALWKKTLPESDWEKANAHFENSSGSRVGKWRIKGKIPDEWLIELGGLSFQVGLSNFKHNGIFPEQSPNWDWIGEVTENAGDFKNSTPRSGNPPDNSSGNSPGDKNISVLNLFGYTGGATLAAAKAGAAVTHVDASKVSIGRARENAKLSGLEERPIRWILDDALSFVKREARRGSKYDAIIMDPPAFGRGPKNELWKIEEHLPILLSECKKILSDDPIFVLINGYASGYSAIAYKNNIEDLLGKPSAGEIQFGELAIRESGSRRLLPAGIFARFSKNQVSEKN